MFLCLLGSFRITSVLFFVFCTRFIICYLWNPILHYDYFVYNFDNKEKRNQKDYNSLSNFNHNSCLCNFDLRIKCNENSLTRNSNRELLHSAILFLPIIAQSFFVIRYEKQLTDGWFLPNLLLRLKVCCIFLQYIRYSFRKRWKKIDNLYYTFCNKCYILLDQLPRNL